MAAQAQGLEGVIVEEYYESVGADAGGTFSPIPAGYTTYRVYLDLATGYEAQIIFASAADVSGNVLEFKTTTSFYNSPFGAEFGEGIGVAVFGFDATPLDSYVTMGSAAAGQIGVLKSEDTDGSIISGRLENVPSDGIALTTADGLQAGTSASSGQLGLDLSAVGAVGGNLVQTLDGSFFNLDGVQGPTATNKVLIGQFTTDGEFSFKLNVQILGPDGSTERYTHTDAQLNDGTPTTLFPGLIYPSNDVQGCMDALACNFDASATVDDGSCVVPVPDCTSCNATNDGLDLIDADNDGTCDLDDACPGDANKVVPGDCGCGVADTDSDSDGTPDCNDGCPNDASKLAPGECGCGVADTDTDSDGTADCNDACPNDANKVAPGECGCGNADTDSDSDGTADCNDNCPNDANKTEPGDCGCGNVDEDANANGVTDCIEVPGCTDSAADNYNPAANVDDGSCTFGTSFACDGNEGGLEGVIVEEYYETSSADAGDALAPIAAGQTTYRVYLDLAPGYEAQIIFASAASSAGNILEFATTTSFYNSPFGAEFGDGIGAAVFGFGATPLDSYITMGSGAAGQIGVLKADDTNGSLISGRLENIPADGIAITTADGLIAGTSSPTGTLGLNTDAVGAIGGNSVSTMDGSFFNLNGVSGPNADNRVLIGQFTTDGEFSFKLNVQILGPDGSSEIYTHTDPQLNDGTPTRVCGDLIYPGIPGCTDDLACNYDAAATVDDGSCNVPVANCTECDGTDLVLIDDDLDGVCNADEAPGCTDVLACNYDSTVDAGNDDGSCIVPVPDCSECNATNDGLDIIDTDGDQICDADEVDGCTSATACNYDASATDDDGSCIEPVPNCSACNSTNDGLDLVDSDLDGICDADDSCPNFEGENGDICQTTINNVPVDGVIVNCQCATDAVDPVFGCTSATACNYNPAATDDDGSCVEPAPMCVQCIPGTTSFVFIDSDGDGICNADEVDGCTSATACNYDPTATDEDGSCVEPIDGCTGCDGQGGIVLIDTDLDGICDSEEIPGCTDVTACNYDSDATDDDGSCLVPGGCFACFGQNLVFVDTDGDGVCDNDEVDGCTSATACNYDAAATDDDGSCIEPVANCSQCDPQGNLQIIDTDFDGICDADEVPGCTDVLACNYNPAATDDNGSCLIPVEDCAQCFNGGLVTIDTDLDGICNLEDEDDDNDGCADDVDSNPLVADDDNDDDGVGNDCDICQGDDASGDTDGDGICDDSEIPGCTDETACNYDWDATDDNGSCVFPEENCTICDTDGGLILIDADGDKVCDANEIPGCMDPLACNYDANATDDDGSCLIPVDNCLRCNADNTALLFVDSDGDGICDAEEIEGCTDEAACNYNAEATDNDGSCVVPFENCLECSADNTYLVLIDSDNDGICDADEVAGCTDAAACNYNAAATDEDGSCVFPTADCTACNPVTGGLDIIDADGDGVCNADEIAGCMDPIACNYNAEATDAAPCIIPVENCTQCGEVYGQIVLVLIDADGDKVCDAEEVPGCTNPLASNFDPLATDEDGSCVFDVCQDNNTCSSFEGDFGTWTNLQSDDINWNLHEGATPSSFTGPTAAFDGNEYIYVEASFPNYPQKTAVLESGCYEIGGPSVVSFAYHMQGSAGTVGNLQVELSINGSAFAPFWAAYGAQGANWNEVALEIPALAEDGDVRFRVIATTGFSWKGDIAVDNFCVAKVVEGCTDALADNYNANATIDDGSCTFLDCGDVVTSETCSDFESDLGFWNQSSDDDFNWMTNSGATASMGTGPSDAYEGNSYLYMEASAPNNPFKVATIVSDCIDLSAISNPGLSFAYHMYGSYVGSLYLQASVDGQDWSYIWWKSGNQGNEWETANVSLADFAGSTIRLRLIGVTAHGWQGDMAIDGFCLNSNVQPAPIQINGRPDHRSVQAKDLVVEYQAPEYADVAEEFEFTIFPNPITTSQTLRVELNNIGSDVEKVQIRIFDITGRIVVEEQYGVAAKSMTQAIELDSRLGNGTYLVSVVAGDVQESKRLIIAD